MAAQNIRYAELTVTPYISITDELPAEASRRSRTLARQQNAITIWSCGGSSTFRPTSDCRQPS